ncbi:toprim domain-containing protein [Spirillospora sp. NPDC052242]
MTAPDPEEQQRRLDVLEGIAAHAAVRLVSGKLPWNVWLENASQHGRYGFTNTLLIPAQRRTATDVRSYEGWRKVGRQVRRGETGIRILSTRAKVRSVFDIEQTDGNPLDLPAERLPEGLERLLQIAADLDLYVDRGRGWTYLGRPGRRLVLPPELDDVSAASLLAHQFAHVIQPKGQLDGAHGQPAGCHGVRRVIADSVAYLLLAEMGLPVDHLRFTPAESWAGTDARAAPAAAVRAVGERIVSTAMRLWRRLEDGSPKPAVVPATIAVGGASEAPRETSTLEPGKQARPKREELLAALADAHRFYRRNLLGSWGTGYLSRRGFSAKVQERWEIGQAPRAQRALVRHLRELGHDDRTLVEAGLARQTDDAEPFDVLRDRVLFPLRDREGAVVGFIGRRRDEGKGPKYLNTPVTALFKKRELLFGLHEVRGQLAGPARPLLVEGPLDAIAVNTVMPQTYAAVAPCGTAISPAHLGSLAAIADLDAQGLVIALDGDPAGRAGAVRAWRTFQDVTWPIDAAVLPHGLDPADLLSNDSRHSVTGALQSAAPLVDLVVDETIERFGGTLEFIESRLTAARAAARLIADLPPTQISRQVVRVSVRTQVEVTEVTAAVAAAISPEPGVAPAADDFPLPPLADSGPAPRATSGRAPEPSRRSHSR